MIFEAHQVKFIVTGKMTTARLPSRKDGSPPARRGHSYALQKRTPKIKDDNGIVIKAAELKTTPHRLLVTSVKRDTEGFWAVTFEIDKRAPDIYMHRNSERGYTTTPAYAMRGEPASTATREDLERYAQAAEDKRAERRRRQKERTLSAKLKRARSAGIDTEPIIDKALGELDTAA